MTIATSKTMGNSRQRSFWLRCFLGRAVAISFLCLSTSALLKAQVEAPKPIYLAHVDGYVVNSFGKPLVNADVTLVQNDRVAFSTRTDKAGAFHIDHVTGHYTFRVARTEFAPAVQEIRVGDLIENYVERKKLYVIVGPGACADACSSIFTSKHEFQKAIQEKNRH